MSRNRRRSRGPTFGSGAHDAGHVDGQGAEMEVDGDARAYDALSQHARIADLAAIAHALMTTASEARRLDPDVARVPQLAKERQLTQEDAETSFGNALEVLNRGPTNAAESDLSCALAAHALAAHPPTDRAQTDRAALDLFWLAVHTPFDATGLIDRALGPSAGSLWEAVAERIRGAGRKSLPSGDRLEREEALVAAIALAASAAKIAEYQVSLLAREVSDRTLLRILCASARGVRKPLEPLRGEMAPAPRGPWATGLLAVTGLLFVVQAARLFGQLALAYKRPAEILVLDDGGVRIKWRVELLGRTLRDRDVLVPRTALSRAAREVRFRGMALYAGLLALAFGSYVGVSAFVDGVRAASPALLAAGLLIVALGLAVDFILSCALPGARGRCRVVFVPRSGGPLCVGGLDLTRADAVLARLASG
jgi:hypothetical protein